MASRATHLGFNIFQMSHSGHLPIRVFNWSFYINSCFWGHMPKALTSQHICDSLLVIKKVSCPDRQTKRHPPCVLQAGLWGGHDHRNLPLCFEVDTWLVYNTSSTPSKITLCICTSATSH